MSMRADLFKANLTAKPAKTMGLKEGSPLGCVDESSEYRIPVQLRWYHRLAFAALSIGIILWNAVKLSR